MSLVRIADLRRTCWWRSFDFSSLVFLESGEYVRVSVVSVVQLSDYQEKPTLLTL